MLNCRVVLILAICGVVFVAKARSQTPPAIVLSESVAAKCLSNLREGMRSGEFWPSIHAAEGLTLAGYGAEVGEYLEPFLETIDDDQQRCGVARELVRAGDWMKAGVMLDILEGKDPHGHVHAAESLYKVLEIGDGNALRRAMKNDDNSKLKLMSAAALGRCGNPSAMRILRRALLDDDPDTRRIAAWVLARIGDETDIPQLRANLLEVKDDLSRAYVEHALASLGDPDGLRALEKNLRSDDPAIRTYAATFAGDARAGAAAPRLIQLLADENLDVRVRSAQSLLVLAQSDPQRTNISQLTYPSTADHPRYTEGSIVRLKDGSLLFAVTEFGGDGSDFSQAKIVARRSADGGRSWQVPFTLQETTGQINVMSVTLIRLRKPRQDTIAMFYLQKNAFDDLRVFVRFSSDEARSFGEPIRVTRDSGYHVLNNDRVTQLTSGRLLVPVASTPDVRKVNHFTSYCWFSDDGGRTWERGSGAVDLPKRGAMEPEVVELTNGNVMMIMRTQLGYIAFSVSSDHGNSWSDPQPLADLNAPEAPSVLRRVPSTGDLVLIWNNTFTPDAGHGGRRTPLTVAISDDEGKTWSRVQNLESRPDKTYSYPSVLFLQNRVVMSYWENDGRLYSSRFRSLPVSWFYPDSGLK